MRHCLLLLVLSAMLLSGRVSAQVPKLVNYQGRVAVDAVNFEGAGQFKFALVSSNGTTTFWSNDGTSAGGSEPTAAVTLVVAKGLYSVLLGDTALGNMTTISASVFANADVRLRVWFNDGAHGSQLLTPDQRLAPAAYLADGIVTSASIGTAAVTSGKIAAGAVSGTNVAPASLTSGNFATVGAPVNGQVLGFNNGGLTWTAPGGGVFSLNGTNAYYNGGNVGIGTLSPTSTLDVRGSLTLEAGSSPVLFTGTGNAELNRYLLLGNSPTAQTASGLKAGGLLVSNDFSYANPGKSDLVVKGNVGIGGSQTFGSSTRQMITLYDSGPNSTFGVGVQSASYYQRTGAGSGFAWFQAGVHNDTQYNPGTGGTTRMILDGNGNLILPLGGSGGGLQIGTPNFETGMSIVGSNRADIRFDGSTLKLLAGAGTGIPSATNGIAVNTSGNVGIGTTAPLAKLHAETTQANTAAIYAKSATGPAVRAEGDATQARDKSGFVKALAFIDPFLPANQSVVRCYNSQQAGAAVSTSPCGITVTRLSEGWYKIDFGFYLQDRFLNVTPDGMGSSAGITSAHIDSFNNNVYVAIWDPAGHFLESRFFITLY